MHIDRLQVNGIKQQFEYVYSKAYDTVIDPRYVTMSVLSDSSEGSVKIGSTTSDSCDWKFFDTKSQPSVDKNGIQLILNRSVGVLGQNMEPLKYTNGYVYTSLYGPWSDGSLVSIVDMDSMTQVSPSLYISNPSTGTVVFKSKGGKNLKINISNQAKIKVGVRIDTSSLVNPINIYGIGQSYTLNTKQVLVYQNDAIAIDVTKTTNIRYFGKNRSFSAAIINGQTIIFGDIDGYFVWDINGHQQYIFSKDGQVANFLIGTVNYNIKITNINNMQFVVSSGRSSSPSTGGRQGGGTAGGGVVPSTGDFVQYGTTGSGPYCLVSDSNGNVYSSNFNGDSISRLDVNGNITLFASLPSGSKPAGMVMDSLGNIYVANSGRSNISKIDSTGSIIETWATGSTPLGICIHDNNVFTANSGSNNVTMLGNQYLSKSFDLQRGNGPQYGTFDSFGNIYITNKTSNIVQKVSSNCVVLSTYNVGSSPLGICVDSSNNIFTANSGDNTVSKIDSNGNVIPLAFTGSSPWGIVSVQSGQRQVLYVTTKSDNSITKIQEKIGNVKLGQSLVIESGIYVSKNSGSMYFLRSTATSVSGANPNQDRDVYLVKVKPDSIIINKSYTGDFSNIHTGLIAQNRKLRINSQAASMYVAVQKGVNQAVYIPGVQWNHMSVVTQDSSHLNGNFINTFAYSSGHYNRGIDVSGSYSDNSANIYVSNSRGIVTLTRHGLGQIPLIKNKKTQQPLDFKTGYLVSLTGKYKSIAVNSIGTVYTASSNVNGSFRISEDGSHGVVSNFKADFIHIDSLDRVYYCSQSNNSVSMSSNGGETFSSYLTQKTPNSICTDSNGIIYISNKDSKSITQVGTYPNAASVFFTVPDRIYSVVSDSSENIYVLSQGHARKYSSGGVLLSTIASPSVSDYEMFSGGTHFVAYDAFSGKCYALINGNRIGLIDFSQGTFSPHAQIPDSKGICVNSYGQVFSTCYSKNCIAKIGNSSASASKINLSRSISSENLSGFSRGAWSDGLGFVYMLQYGRVLKIDLESGNVVTYILVPDGEYLIGCVYNSVQTLYVANWSRHLYKIVIQQNPVAVNIDLGIPSDKYGPHFLVSDYSGNVYASFTGGIKKIDNNGNVTDFLVSSVFQSSYANKPVIACDGSNIYYTQGNSSGGDVYKVDSSGIVSSIVSGDIRINSVKQVICDDSGRVIVWSSPVLAVSSSGSISQISNTQSLGNAFGYISLVSDGLSLISNGFVKRIPSLSNVAQVRCFDFNGGDGPSVSYNGFLYVVSNSFITKVGNQYGVSVFYNGQNTNFIKPYGIACGPNDDLFVSGDVSGAPLYMITQSGNYQFQSTPQYSNDKGRGVFVNQYGTVYVITDLCNAYCGWGDAYNGQWIEMQSSGYFAQCMCFGPDNTSYFAKGYRSTGDSKYNCSVSHGVTPYSMMIDSYVGYSGMCTQNVVGIVKNSNGIIVFDESGMVVKIGQGFGSRRLADYGSLDSTPIKLVYSSSENSIVMLRRSNQLIVNDHSDTVDSLNLVSYPTSFVYTSAQATGGQLFSFTLSSFSDVNDQYNTIKYYIPCQITSTVGVYGTTDFVQDIEDSSVFYVSCKSGGFIKGSAYSVIAKVNPTSQLVSVLKSYSSGSICGICMSSFNSQLSLYTSLITVRDANESAQNDGQFIIYKVDLNGVSSVYADKTNLTISSGSRIVSHISNGEQILYVSSNETSVPVIKCDIGWYTSNYAQGMPSNNVLSDLKITSDSKIGIIRQTCSWNQRVYPSGVTLLRDDHKSKIWRQNIYIGVAEQTLFGLCVDSSKNLYAMSSGLGLQNAHPSSCKVYKFVPWSYSISSLNINSGLSLHDGYRNLVISSYRRSNGTLYVGLSSSVSDRVCRISPDGSVVFYNMPLLNDAPICVDQFGDIYHFNTIRQLCKYSVYNGIDTPIFRSYRPFEEYLVPPQVYSNPYGRMTIDSDGYVYWMAKGQVTRYATTVDVPQTENSSAVTSQHSYLLKKNGINRAIGYKYNASVRLGVQNTSSITGRDSLFMYNSGQVDNHYTVISLDANGLYCQGFGFSANGIASVNSIISQSMNNLPECRLITNGDSLYVQSAMDSNGSRPTGLYVLKTGLDSPFGVCCDYYSDTSFMYVYFNSSMSNILYKMSVPASGRSYYGSMSDPVVFAQLDAGSTHLCMDSDGNVYSINSTSINRVTPSGSVSILSGLLTSVTSTFKTFVTSQSGISYFYFSCGQIIRVDSNGVFARNYAGLSLVLSKFGFGANGELYGIVNNSLIKITAQNGFQVVLDYSSQSYVADVDDASVDRQGNISLYKHSFSQIRDIDDLNIVFINKYGHAISSGDGQPLFPYIYSLENRHDYVVNISPIIMRTATENGPWFNYDTTQVYGAANSNYLHDFIKDPNSKSFVIFYDSQASYVLSYPLTTATANLDNDGNLKCRSLSDIGTYGSPQFSNMSSVDFGLSVKIGHDCVSCLSFTQFDNWKWYYSDVQSVYVISSQFLRTLFTTTQSGDSIRKIDIDNNGIVFLKIGADDSIVTVPTHSSVYTSSAPIGDPLKIGVLPDTGNVVHSGFFIVSENKAVYVLADMTVKMISYSPNHADIIYTLSDPNSVDGHAQIWLKKGSVPLYVSDNGDVYISDGSSRTGFQTDGNGQLVKINSSDNSVQTNNVYPVKPKSVVFSNDCLYHITSDSVFKYGLQWVNQAVASSLSSPQGIVYDGNSGDLYVANSGGSTISKIATYVDAGHSQGSIVSSVSVGSGPSSLCLDGSGNVYSANTGGNSVSIVQAGGSVQTFSIGYSPTGISVGLDGNIYATSNSRIIKVTPTGSVDSNWAMVSPGATGIITSGTSQFVVAYTFGFNYGEVSKVAYGYGSQAYASVGSNPVGIVSDSAGNIYTANKNSNSISKIDGLKNSTVTFSSVGHSPVWMVMDSANSIYVTCNGGNSVYKVNSTSGSSVNFATTSSNPVGIAIDNSNTLYVANSGNGSVSKITPSNSSSGTTTTIASGVGISPYGLILSEGLLYSANFGSNTISKINIP